MSSDLKFVRLIAEEEEVPCDTLLLVGISVLEALYLPSLSSEQAVQTIISQSIAITKTKEENQVRLIRRISDSEKLTLDRLCFRQKRQWYDIEHISSIINQC